MSNLTGMTMQEDVELREASLTLWEMEIDRPQIRQIFGHFLPPHHMKIVDGLVAKDFNFPAAYHCAPNLCTLTALHSAGGKLTHEVELSMDESVIMREEEDGAVLYTPYHNGFYVNVKACRILQLCMRRCSVQSILSVLGLDRQLILEFLARVLTLGIVHVHET